MGPLDRNEARAVDAAAQERLGIPGDVLMENAGRTVAEQARRLAVLHARRRVVVLAGPGNNGGDGFVAARHLRQWPDDVDAVDVVLCGDPDRVTGDARANLERWRALGGDVTAARDAGPVVAALAGPSAVVIDALFGTGLDRPVEGWRRDAIEATNAAHDTGAPVVAVDLPSGLDADTGAVLGAAVRATVTVTFVAAKVGFDRDPAPAHCGEVVVAPIGFPPDALTP